MDAKSFLPRIRAAGFELQADGGDILIAPFSRLTDRQKAFIREHKPELLRALTGSVVSAEKVSGVWCSDQKSETSETGPETSQHAPKPCLLPNYHHAACVDCAHWRGRCAIGMVVSDPVIKARICGHFAHDALEPPPIATTIPNEARPRKLPDH
jgi:hypothetical protein